MPQFKLPINEAPYYNTDDIANSIAANDMFDCYLEPVPGLGFVTRRRPGLVDFTDLGTGIHGDGIFWWDAAAKCIAVSSGQIFEIHQDGTSTDITGDPLIAGVPVIFADGQKLDGTPWLYMANGRLIYTINGAKTVQPSDASTPNATHIDYINQRFIANKPGTSRMWFTDTNPATGNMENDYWSSTSNPIRNTARGDYLLAVRTCWEEVYSWGSLGLQIWQDDGATPFTPVQSAFSEVGLEAPYSIVRVENTLFALCVLDGKRVVVKMAGRAPQVISEPIARILSEMGTVSDAIGDLINVGGMAIYLLSFPTEGQTWAYDHKNDTWSRWGLYYGNEDLRHRFLGQHACFCKGWNKHLIMSRVDGKIYELSRNAMDDAGAEMISYRRTGWFDAEVSDTRKRCDQFYVKAKPGVTDVVKLMIRSRDNGVKTWSRFTELNFQNNTVEPMNRQGTFRTRQWEFRIPAGVDAIIMSAKGSFKELKN